MEAGALLLDCTPIRGDCDWFVVSCLLHVLEELFPMNPAVSGFRVVVRQVNLARPALARHHISGEDAAPSTAPSLRKFANSAFT